MNSAFSSLKSSFSQPTPSNSCAHTAHTLWAVWVEPTLSLNPGWSKRVADQFLQQSVLEMRTALLTTNLVTSADILDKLHGAHVLYTIYMRQTELGLVIATEVHISCSQNWRLRQFFVFRQ